MLSLQRHGCHNINLVTPEHVVPQILEALVPAIEQGLRLPLVYNTSAYDSLETLALLDGIVDIYMPDLKFFTAEASRRYLKAADYPEVAQAAVREMHRQVGHLSVDDRGIARRGVLIRHLVMPGLQEETRSILQWIAKDLGPECYLNLMDQYRPGGRVKGDAFPELNRPLPRAEYQSAIRTARSLGLEAIEHLPLIS
jgi:putative pyruvate formate lyase activating enzyme